MDEIVKGKPRKSELDENVKRKLKQGLDQIVSYKMNHVGLMQFLVGGVYQLNISSSSETDSWSIGYTTRRTRKQGDQGANIIFDFSDYKVEGQRIHASGNNLGGVVVDEALEFVHKLSHEFGFLYLGHKYNLIPNKIQQEIERLRFQIDA